MLGRRLLMFNDDVEIGDLPPDRGAGLLLPQRRGRRGHLRPRGLGRARDDLRDAALPRARLRRDPARHHLPVPPRRRAAVADLPHPRGDRDPEPLPQPLRPAARARALLAPGLPPARPTWSPTASGATTSWSSACAAATSATASTTTRSTSSAGTATSTRTRSTSTTSSRSPAASTCRRRCTRPSRARTSSSARSARGCSTGNRTPPTRRSRSPTTTPTSSREEMIYYVSGRLRVAHGASTSARSRCTRPACRTARSPGLAEKSIGKRCTDELAVMCDTFRPLRLTPLCQALDDGRYALSWAAADRRRAGGGRRCLRRPSSTRRSRPPTTARSPSTSTRTTPASAIPTTARGATTSPLARCGWAPGQADPARRLHRGRAGGLAHGVPRAGRQARAPGVRASTATRWRALALPADHIPQLDEVCRPAATADRLSSTTRPPGWCGFDQFYGSLADGVFHSTQYVRHHARPLYTPEPDLIHEVIGHGGTAGQPAAGRAQPAGRAGRAPAGDPGRARLLRQGVLVHDRVRRRCTRTGELRAYGAGLLSSYGEIEEFRAAEIRPLDIAEMGVLEYDITQATSRSCSPPTASTTCSTWSAASSPSATTTPRRA